MASSPAESQLLAACNASFALAAGWVFFGVVFGLLEDKTLGFVLSLFMGACTLATSLYERRRAAGLPPS